MHNKTKQTLVGYAFLAPALVIFLTLVLMPVIVSFLLAFTKWNFFSGFSNLKFVGLDNFVKMFTSDKSIKSALGNTFIYVIGIVPVTVFASMLLAYAVNGKVYCQRFMRLAFFIPYISNMVALGAVFKFLFSADGTINEILERVFHVSQVPNWLATPSLSKIPIICVMIYSGIGFCLIVYIAALKNVPQDLYDAAELDGASSMRQFFSITVPMVSPTTFYLVIVRMINAFQIFAAINIITSSSGKSSGSASLVTIIYNEAFNNYNFGYASAIAWVLVLLVLIVTLINFKLQKKWVHY